MTCILLIRVKEQPGCRYLELFIIAEITFLSDDLARSIIDGRYPSQKQKMIEWKKNFKDFQIEANLKYLVEGDPKQYVVKCTDGCGGVLKCGWPTAKKLEVSRKNYCAGPSMIIIDNIFFLPSNFFKEGSSSGWGPTKRILITLLCTSRESFSDWALSGLYNGGCGLRIRQFLAKLESIWSSEYVLRAPRSRVCAD